jgi:hypothetical protein
MAQDGITRGGYDDPDYVTGTSRRAFNKMAGIGNYLVPANAINSAADLAKKKGLDYGADFSQIDVVQENIIKLARQAEQFIIKVYKVDNENVKAVEALHSIYKMLNDKAKEEEFKKKCKELNIKID